MERPDSVVSFEPSRELYPFESRWFDSSIGPVHYVDEGIGPPLLLLHGNPDWSFLYRKIILGLRDRFRCIAPDGRALHPGGRTGPDHRCHPRYLRTGHRLTGPDAIITTARRRQLPAGGRERRIIPPASRTEPRGRTHYRRTRCSAHGS